MDEREKSNQNSGGSWAYWWMKKSKIGWHPALAVCGNTLPKFRRSQSSLDYNLLLVLLAFSFPSPSLCPIDLRLAGRWLHIFWSSNYCKHPTSRGMHRQIPGRHVGRGGGGQPVLKHIFLEQCFSPRIPSITSDLTHFSTSDEFSSSDGSLSICWWVFCYT